MKLRNGGSGRGVLPVPRTKRRARLPLAEEVEGAARALPVAVLDASTGSGAAGSTLCDCPAVDAGNAVGPISAVTLAAVTAVTHEALSVNRSCHSAESNRPTRREHSGQRSKRA
jgi:hypothetical protein